MRVCVIRFCIHSNFSQTHKVGNVGTIANFVFPYICSFLLSKMRNQGVYEDYTNLTFLAFLYKIDITGFQNQQKLSCLHWVLNSQHQPHLLEFQLPYPFSHKYICWIEDSWTELGSFQVWDWNGLTDFFSRSQHNGQNTECKLTTVVHSFLFTHRASVMHLNFPPPARNLTCTLCYAWCRYYPQVAVLTDGFDR